ncbi:MAG TPA: hypothetical protein VFM37_01180, partial [Pseudonocardiaceae bacterium]|nr:hypothetical protein [Pseudonocardiaceae bacterium]
MLGGIAVVVPTAAIAGVPAYASIADSLPRVQLPAEVELRLPAGEYRAYSEGLRPSDGAAGGGGGPVDVSDCTLTGPDGGTVELREAANSAVYNIGDVSGIGQFEFDAADSGSYRLSCNGSSTTLALLRSQPSNGTVMLVGSVVSITAGLILGAVVAGRRRRARTAVPGPHAPPDTKEEASGLLGREQVLHSFLANSATTREADYDQASARSLMRAVIVIAIVAVLATVTAVATVT